MRLPQPFIRLPIRFDAARLRSEVEALPAEAWSEHPNRIEGNQSLRLVTVDGGSNDDVNGPMGATPWLLRSPYVRQVLASFNVVWSRSRFMRLAPGAIVPEHADINRHWHTRVRVHIPVLTNPQVRFHCDGQSVHMAAGEAWIFDNWRRHHVVNPAGEPRVHLVADTSGTSAFWQLAFAAARQADLPVRELQFEPGSEPMPLFEGWFEQALMSPAEVDWLIGDLRAELAVVEDSASARAQLAQYHALLHGFAADWRQLYLLHGESPVARAEFLRLRDRLRAASRGLSAALVTVTNRVNAHTVLEGRLLRHLVSEPQPAAAAAATLGRAAGRLDRPVFIVAAPRSGSTLLFETLAASSHLVTCGGEAHWLIESHPELTPGAPGVDSNRLEARHCSAELAARIVASVPPRLVTSSGAPAGGGQRLRWLEKTPKNALRIPFLRAVFPDALFVFLRREPRDNIASIIEAWLSGRFVTYPQLPGWEGSWSLLLPPGWQALRGRPLEEIAAQQWLATNRLIAADLASLPEGCWTAVDYRELVEDPVATVARLCGFIGIPFDAALRARTAQSLPPSRFVLSPPEQGKWRRQAERLARVLPAVEPFWQDLNRRSGS